MKPDFKLYVVFLSLILSLDTSQALVGYHGRCQPNRSKVCAFFGCPSVKPEDTLKCVASMTMSGKGITKGRVNKVPNRGEQGMSNDWLRLNINHLKPLAENDWVTVSFRLTAAGTDGILLACSRTAGAKVVFQQNRRVDYDVLTPSVLPVNKANGSCAFNLPLNMITYTWAVAKKVFRLQDTNFLRIQYGLIGLSGAFNGGTVATLKWPEMTFPGFMLRHMSDRCEHNGVYFQKSLCLGLNCAEDGKECRLMIKVVYKPTERLFVMYMHRIGKVADPLKLDFGVSLDTKTGDDIYYSCDPSGISMVKVVGLNPMPAVPVTTTKYKKVEFEEVVSRPEGGQIIDKLYAFRCSWSLGVDSEAAAGHFFNSRHFHLYLQHDFKAVIRTKREVLFPTFNTKDASICSKATNKFCFGLLYSKYPKKCLENRNCKVIFSVEQKGESVGLNVIGYVSEMSWMSVRMTETSSNKNLDFDCTFGFASALKVTLAADGKPVVGPSVHSSATLNPAGSVHCVWTQGSMTLRVNYEYDGELVGEKRGEEESGGEPGLHVKDAFFDVVLSYGTMKSIGDFDRTNPYDRIQLKAIKLPLGHLVGEGEETLATTMSTPANTARSTTAKTAIRESYLLWQNPDTYWFILIVLCTFGLFTGTVVIGLLLCATEKKVT